MTTLAADLIYRELNWVPDPVRVGLRATTIILAAAIVLIILESLKGRPGGTRPTHLRWLLRATLLWNVRVILAGGEKWHDPIQLGITPITILIQILVLIGWIAALHQAGVIRGQQLDLEVEFTEPSRTTTPTIPSGETSLD